MSLTNNLQRRVPRWDWHATSSYVNEYECWQHELVQLCFEFKGNGIAIAFEYIYLPIKCSFWVSQIYQTH